MNAVIATLIPARHQALSAAAFVTGYASGGQNVVRFWEGVECEGQVTIGFRASTKSASSLLIELRSGDKYIADLPAHWGCDPVPEKLTVESPFLRKVDHMVEFAPMLDIAAMTP